MYRVFKYNSHLIRALNLKHWQVARPWKLLQLEGRIAHLADFLIIYSHLHHVKDIKSGMYAKCFFQVQVRLVMTSRVINWKEKRGTSKRASFSSTVSIASMSSGSPFIQNKHLKSMARKKVDDHKVISEILSPGKLHCSRQIEHLFIFHGWE